MHSFRLRYSPRLVGNGVGMLGVCRLDHTADAVIGLYRIGAGAGEYGCRFSIAKAEIESMKTAGCLCGSEFRSCQIAGKQRFADNKESFAIDAGSSNGGAYNTRHYFGLSLRAEL